VISVIVQLIAAYVMNHKLDIGITLLYLLVTVLSYYFYYKITIPAKEPAKDKPTEKQPRDQKAKAAGAGRPKDSMGQNEPLAKDHVSIEPFFNSVDKQNQNSPNH
jgi:hypothetical protein